MNVQEQIERLDEMRQLFQKQGNHSRSIELKEIKASMEALQKENERLEAIINDPVSRCPNCKYDFVPVLKRQELLEKALREISIMPNEEWRGNAQTIGCGLPNCHKVALAALKEQT